MRKLVGYALGEGVGRLACISFGCCYGKALDRMPQLVQRYFSWAYFLCLLVTQGWGFSPNFCDPIIAETVQSASIRS